MRFANPEFLWLLLALPAMALYLRFFRAGDVPALRVPTLRALPGEGRASLSRLVALPGLLRILAVAALIVAVARPQKGLRSEEVTTRATDVMIVLDASRSMLSLDFKPQNRFEAAKEVIKEFVRGRQQDRLGLVMFAQYAVTLCPLTVDRDAVAGIIDTLKVGDIAPDETAIGMGIATAVQRLRDSKAKSRVIILLTDGVNNAGSVDPVTAARAAQAYGIKIYAIGAATPEGGLMPIDDPLMGRRLVQTRSDIDEPTLTRVAELTGGKYFRAKSEGALKEIFAEIDAMEKTDIKVTEYVDYRELYWPFVLFAFAVLFTELLLARTALRTLP